MRPSFTARRCWYGSHEGLTLRFLSNPHSCANTGKAVPKDKAIKRMLVRYVDRLRRLLRKRRMSAGVKARFSFYTSLVPQRDSSIVDQSSARDIKEARVFENYQLPKLYIKQYYSVEAAVHQRLVRSRSKDDRRNRAPPERKRPGQR